MKNSSRIARLLDGIGNQIRRADVRSVPVVEMRGKYCRGFARLEKIRNFSDELCPLRGVVGARLKANVVESAAAAAAKEMGAFYDTFEINEPANKVQKCPWFSTGSGNYVYAVNQMLLRPTESGEIYLCSSVPDSWKDIDFFLPTYGGLWFGADIKNGRLVYAPLENRGNGEKSAKRTLIVPLRFVEESRILAKWQKRGEYAAIEIEAGRQFYR